MSVRNFQAPHFLYVIARTIEESKISIGTVDITLVPALGKVVIREARSGERLSFAISAVKGSLGLVLEKLASGSFFFGVKN